MKTKATLLLSSMGFLAACGGSSDGSAVNSITPAITSTPTNGFTSPPATIVAFQDGGGVLKAAYNPEVIAITDDLQGWLNNLKAEEIADIDLNALADETVGWPLSSLSKMYEGSVTLAGNPYIGTILTPYAGDTTALVAWSENAVFDSATVWGPKASEVPQGNFEYSGINLISLRNVPVLDITGEPIYTGTGEFQMTVSFDTGVGTLTANTVNINNTALTGNLQIDSVNGTYSSDSLVLSGSLGDVVFSDKSASISGNFHGVEATGVSGIYYSNDETIGGIILGSKNP